jgi:hypothetical protein
MAQVRLKRDFFLLVHHENGDDVRHCKRNFPNPNIDESGQLVDAGCRKINVFQVGGFVGKNLRNLEKIK